MRVLLWSPYASWHLHTCYEVTIAEALRQRGASVHTLLCNGLFNECDIYRRGLNWTPEGRPRNACQRCQALAAWAQAGADNPFEWLGVYIPRDLYAQIRSFADSLPTDALMTAQWAGRPVGEWAQSSAFYQFRMSRFELSDPVVVTSLREHVYGTVLAYEGLTRAWDVIQPDVLFTFNGRFFAQRAALELAAERGVRVITHERGVRKNTLAVMSGTNVFERSSYDRAGQWVDAPLTATEAYDTWSWLDDRRYHRNLAWRPFSPKPQEEDALRAALRLDARPIVAVFTSSDDEVAAMPALRAGAFPDSMEWIPASIAAAREMPEAQWVIRMHPNLVGYGQNDQALEQARRLARDLPENVRIVMPADPISSYTLADIAAVGVAYMTTLGMEMAARGQPVVAVAQGWYGGMPMVRSCTNPADYARMIREALPAPRSWSIAVQTFRFLNRIHRERAIPFPLVTDLVKGGAGELHWKSPDELAHGRHPTLDAITDAVLTGRHILPTPTDADRSRSTTAETRFLLRSYPFLAEAPDRPAPTACDELIAEGEAAYETGDLRRAEGAFRMAVSLDPDHPEAWLDLATTLHARGDADREAIGAIARAIRLDPYDPQSWANLVNMHATRGRTFDARARLRDALGLLPEAPELVALAAELGIS